MKCNRRLFFYALAHAAAVATVSITGVQKQLFGFEEPAFHHEGFGKITIDSDDEIDESTHKECAEGLGQYADICVCVNEVFVQKIFCALDDDTHHPRGNNDLQR